MISYKDETYEVRTDHIGDLDKMLYPRALTPEDEVYYDKATTFAYVGEVESNFDPKITTVNPVKEGSPCDVPGFLRKYPSSFLCGRLCQRLFFQGCSLSAQ